MSSISCQKHPSTAHFVCMTVVHSEGTFPQTFRKFKFEGGRNMLLEVFLSANNSNSIILDWKNQKEQFALQYYLPFCDGLAMIIIVENIDMFIKGLAIKLKAHLFSDNRVSTISAKHVIIKVIIGIIFKFNNHIIADIFHRNYLNSLLNEDILLIKFFLQQLLSASLRIDVEVGKFCFIVEETGDLVINKNF